jgi:hypothetical protein
VRPVKPIVLALGMLAYAPAFMSPAAAQQPDRTGAPRAVSAALLVGSTTYVHRLHPLAGARVGWEREGWGALALAEVGRSGTQKATTGYDSRALAAAATRRMLGGGAWSVSLLAGAGHYGEEGGSGIRRSAPVLLAGAEARRRLGPLSVYLLVTNFRGRYGGDDVRDAFAFDVPRIRAGVGY